MASSSPVQPFSPAPALVRRLHNVQRHIPAAAYVRPPVQYRFKAGGGVAGEPVILDHDEIEQFAVQPGQAVRPAIGQLLINAGGFGAAGIHRLVRPHRIGQQPHVRVAVGLPQGGRRFGNRRRDAVGHELLHGAPVPLSGKRFLISLNLERIAVVFQQPPVHRIRLCRVGRESAQALRVGIRGGIPARAHPQIEHAVYIQVLRPGRLQQVGHRIEGRARPFP